MVSGPLDDRVRLAVAAFVAADDRMDPRSAAAGGCWEAALTAAGLPDALARVAELEAEVEILQAPGSAYDLGQQRQSDVDTATMTELRAKIARVAELEAVLVQAEDYAREAGTERDEAEAHQAALVAAITPLMDREVVTPFITEWLIGGLDGPDGEALYEALRAAWEAAK